MKKYFITVQNKNTLQCLDSDTGIRINYMTYIY